MTLFHLAAAVNDRMVLAQCLARSPDVCSGALDLAVYEHYQTAGAAYNAALDTAADAAYVLFVHQDVYLPTGTLTRLTDQLRSLDTIAPNWAVAGVIGGDARRSLVGETWCSGHNRVLGARCAYPAEVETLDEMLLIVRTASGVRFDPKLPSFHLYGADIILTAQNAGMSAWVIDLPVVHHSRPVISLSGAYLAAYRYIQHKWRAELPVFNLVCPLEANMLRYWITQLRLRRKHRARANRPDPEGDPVAIARRIGYEGSAGLRAVT